MKQWAVAHNPDKLPRAWRNDPLLYEQTIARIRALGREGYSQVDIARRVGCSSRHIGQILAR